MDSTPDDTSAGLEPTSACLSGPHQTYRSGDEIPFKSTRELGRGTYGIVDEVESTSAPALKGKSYARKVIRLPPYQTDRIRREFEKEVNILKGLKHQHIISLVFTYEELSFLRGLKLFGIIMEPVAESDLAEFLEILDAVRFNEETSFGSITQTRPRGGPFLNNFRSRINKWYGCLASGLAYIHQQRITHKDIKPTNILVKGAEVLFADFGLSTVFDEDTTMKTKGRAGPRTPMYCAPEVALKQPRGPPADIFSLGCVFLEMATVRSRESLAEYSRTRGAPRPQAYHLRCDESLTWMLHLFRQSEGKPNYSPELWMPVQWCCDMLNPLPNKRITADQLATAIARKPWAECSCGDAWKHKPACDQPEFIRTVWLDRYKPKGSSGLETEPVSWEIASRWPNPRGNGEQNSPQYLGASHTPAHREKVQPVGCNGGVRLATNADMESEEEESDDELEKMEPEKELGKRERVWGIGRRFGRKIKNSLGEIGKKQNIKDG